MLICPQIGYPKMQQWLIIFCDWHCHKLGSNPHFQTPHAGYPVLGGCWEVSVKPQGHPESVKVCDEIIMIHVWSIWIHMENSQLPVRWYAVNKAQNVKFGQVDQTWSNSQILETQCRSPCSPIPSSPSLFPSLSMLNIQNSTCWILLVLKHNYEKWLTPPWMEKRQTPRSRTIHQA